MRKQAKEKMGYWTKLSDTLLQCLKGLSTQKDGTIIRMTIDLWYDHGQDPAMLTFNQGAMREHLRLYLQAKSSRRLKIVFTAELKILLPSSLHNFFTMPSKNFTPYICIISHSRVHIPITINKSPCATLPTVSWSIKKKLILAHYYLWWAHILYIYIDSICIHCFICISSKYWSYCTSTAPQLFNSSTTEFQQLKLALVGMRRD